MATLLRFPPTLLRPAYVRRGTGAREVPGFHRLSADLAASVHWQGNDASNFRSDWETAHSRSMILAVHLLETMQRELTANADQQEHASSAGGSAAILAATALPAAPPVALPVAPPVALPGVLPTPAGLGALSPQQVHDLWSGLGAEGQAEFSRLHPFTAGNLDGLPIAGRIEANKVAAAGQLARLDANGRSTGEEARYLRKVLAGRISLVAYDPDQGNLIELLGRYDGSTTTVLTYAPGTFAKAGDLYTGGAQLNALNVPSSSACFQMAGTPEPGVDY